MENEITKSQQEAYNEMIDLLINKVGKTEDEARTTILNLMQGMDASLNGGVLKNHKTK
jgi:polyphosphate kinase 2 (PPK2 family)